MTEPTEPVSPLLDALLSIVADWRTVFARQRSFKRAVGQALGGLLCLGRRTLTRILWTNGREQLPWSAEYLLHSRAPWEAQALFDTVWSHALAFCKGPRVGVALDDTRLHKTGRCIPQAFFQRDPLSPPFHVNLMLGLRFLQASLLIPCHKQSARFGARALPVRFEEVSRVKRPGKKAGPEQWQQWKELQKQFNLSQRAVQSMHALRASLDSAGGHQKSLVIAGDGSFCNRTCFGSIPERAELLVRARKDASLCWRAAPGGRKFYASEKFTPESLRQDLSVPWKTTKLNYGGGRHKVRYKEWNGVYWQRGAKQRPLRVIVIAPTPYRKRNSGRWYYRAPAYLLTTDCTSPATALIQIYLDRWQIEVNHREEKDTLGVGQAQLWSHQSVPKQPVLAVAAYSALMLAGLRAFGAARTEVYAALPAWRRSARRPSCLDLIALLRQETIRHPEALLPFPVNLSPTHSVAAAAA
jgi:hypothetical protein